MIMAAHTVGVGSSDDKVLSDVHVCLLHSEKIDQEKDCQESLKWLSRFQFWLPQLPNKIEETLGTVYTSGSQDDTFNNGHQSTNVLDEKQTHASLERDLLELDEDGDILLVRRQAQSSSQNSAASNKQKSETINVPHQIDYDTRVLLPITKSGNSSPKHHIPQSSSSVSLELEQYRLLTDRERKCENITGCDLDVELYSDVDTQTNVTCDKKMTIQCKINISFDSGIINSGQIGHNFSQNDRVNKSTSHRRTNHVSNVSVDEVRHDVGVLTLEHSLETSLPEVGFQVWSGALLLCDYLIHNHRDLRNSIVLDLGAGTGITSIVAAMFAPSVLCTDYLSSIVAMCERNWERNRDLLPMRTCHQICFRNLDWMCDWTSQNTASNIKYGINPADIKLIERATLILAAEVIYDEELTDGFFRTIYKLFLKCPPKTVLLTIERRIIFSTENQDICSPAYEHFLENLNDLVTVDEGHFYFTAEKMSTAFPQYFQYQRVKELELWTISSHLQVPE